MPQLDILWPKTARKPRARERFRTCLHAAIPMSWRWVKARGSARTKLRLARSNPGVSVLALEAPDAVSCRKTIFLTSAAILDLVRSKHPQTGALKMTVWTGSRTLEPRITRARRSARWVEEGAGRIAARPAAVSVSVARRARPDAKRSFVSTQVRAASPALAKRAHRSWPS